VAEQNLSELILDLLSEIVELQKARVYRAMKAKETADCVDELQLNVLCARLELAREQERRSGPRTGAA